MSASETDMEVVQVTSDGSGNTVEMQSITGPEAGNAQGAARGARQADGQARTDGLEQVQGMESALIEQGEERDTAIDPTAPPAPRTLTTILSLPNPFQIVMDHLSMKDKLRFAKTGLPLPPELWPANPNPEVFKSVTLDDFGYPFIDDNTTFDHEKSEDFIDFLYAVKDVLQELHLPSKFLTHSTAQVLATFPLLGITKFNIRIEKWEALPLLCTHTIAKIPAVESFILEGSYSLYDDTDNDEVNDTCSGILANVFAAMGANCASIRKLDIINWSYSITNIGPQAEAALLQLLPQLQVLSAINLTNTGLSSGCIRSVLALPNIQANLEQFRGDRFFPADLVGLKDCSNLRFIDCYSYLNSPNVDDTDIARSVLGLELEHLHLKTGLLANDLRVVFSDQTGGGLKRIYLSFHGIDNRTDNILKCILTNHSRLQVLVLYDYLGQMDDSSVAKIASLHDLRAIAIKSDAVTGAFLHHLTPETHSDLRMVFILSDKAVDDSVFRAFRDRFGAQATLVIRNRTGFKWFSRHEFPDHFGAKDQIRRALRMLCPSALCCFNDWMRDMPLSSMTG